MDRQIFERTDGPPSAPAISAGAAALLDGVAHEIRRIELLTGTTLRLTPCLAFYALDRAERNRRKAWSPSAPVDIHAAMRALVPPWDH